MLDCRISVQCLALAIAGLSEMTFITNSIPTAAILAESQKFSHLSAYRFAELSEADAVITDRGITSQKTSTHMRASAKLL